MNLHSKPETEQLPFDDALKIISAVSSAGNRGILSVLDQIQKTESLVKFVSLWAINWNVGKIVIVERTTKPYRPIYDGTPETLVECCCPFSIPSVKKITDLIRSTKLDTSPSSYLLSVPKPGNYDRFHSEHTVSSLGLGKYLLLPIWTNANQSHPSHMLLMYLEDLPEDFHDPAQIIGNSTTGLVEQCFTNLIEQRRDRRHAQLINHLINSEIESYDDLKTSFFKKIVEDIIESRGAFLIRGILGKPESIEISSTNAVESCLNSSNVKVSFFSWLVDRKLSNGYIKKKYLSDLVPKLENPRNAIFSRLSGSEADPNFSFLVCYNRRESNLEIFDDAAPYEDTPKKFPTYFRNQDLEHLGLIAQHAKASLYSKQSEEARSGMIKMAAHELLAPVTDIRNLAESLERRRNKRSPEVINRRIYEASQLALTLTHANIVAFADDDFSGFDVGFTDDVGDTLSKWKLMLMGACREHGFSNKNISFEVDDSIKYTRMNQGILATYFFNLVGNSVKYTQKGQSGWCNIRLLSVLTSVSPILRQYPNRPTGVGEGILFSVADNGPGFKRHEEELAFHPYQQFPRGELVKGQGLGLHLVDRVTRKVGGCAWIDKNYVNSQYVDAGSRICIWLPRRAVI